MTSLHAAPDATHTFLHNLQGGGIREYSVGQIGERVVVEVAIWGCRGSITNGGATDNTRAKDQVCAAVLRLPL